MTWAFRETFAAVLALSHVLDVNVHCTFLLADLVTAEFLVFGCLPSALHH
jgi:hypothetical protein